MVGISSLDSASVGMLFSSLGSSKSSGAGTTDLLGINYSDYACIRNGSYFKLMDAYYGDGNKIDGVNTPHSTLTSKDDSKTLTKVKDAADGLTKSSGELLRSGSKSVFNKTATTDETGKTTTGYDTDAVYKAVEQFTKDYNSVLKEAGDSNTDSILRTAKSMINNTKVNEKMLRSIGITIGTDNQLTIDEEAFKKADMSTVKSLFHNTGSYGYQTGVAASRINSYAQNEMSKANTYGKNGAYTYNYTTGELYNSSI